jgi:vacuolar-type H+-ATPase subunit I/STV1
LTLNIVSNQLGVKQKSLFDHLISDTDALEAIARELKRSRHRSQGSVQKTFVVSRKTLATLQKMAETHAASRDALVEFSIRRLKPVIDQEKRKFDSRQRLAERIKAELESLEKLLNEARKQLGADDPLHEHLSQAVEKFDSEYRSIAAYVEKSKRIKDLTT